MKIYVLYTKEWYYTEMVAVFDSRKKAEEYMSKKVNGDSFMAELYWIEEEKMNPEYREEEEEN